MRAIVARARARARAWLRPDRAMRGQGLVEYALILALIAIIVVVAAQRLGLVTRDKMTRVALGVHGIQFSVSPQPLVGSGSVTLTNVTANPIGIGGTPTNPNYDTFALTGDTCHNTTVLPASTCTLTFSHIGGSPSDAIGAIYIDAGGAVAVLVNMKAS